ncbi:MAG: transaldolase [Acidobacteria bacterium]|nr:transaldolase [Acidobacteriota bacterium]
MTRVEDLSVKLFADGAELAAMQELYQRPYIRGFTTNPTLMRKAGIQDYETFARDVLRTIPDRPISFEVFSDELEEMERQARTIASWGSQVYVKIPITNTRRESTHDLVRRLSGDGLHVNVTALMTLDQVQTGRPVLVAANPASQAAQLLRDAEGGMLIAPDDPEALAQAARWFASAEPDVLAAFGASNRAYAEQHFDERKILAAQEQLILDTLGPRPRLTSGPTPADH